MPTHKSLLKDTLIKRFSDGEEFLLSEVYDVAGSVLQKKAPKNKDIHATIRATLQDLRDDAVVTFVSGRKGVYILTIADPIQVDQRSSDSEEEMEPWPNTDDIKDDWTSISKDEMCEMNEIIETLRQENLGLKKQLERKGRDEVDRNKVINKARLAAQPLKTEVFRGVPCGKVDIIEEEPCLNRTWSNEAVCDDTRYTKSTGKQVLFFEAGGAVEQRIYEVDRLMRPHKNWRDKKNGEDARFPGASVIKVASNMGIW